MKQIIIWVIGAIFLNGCVAQENKIIQGTNEVATSEVAENTVAIEVLEKSLDEMEKSKSVGVQSRIKITTEVDGLKTHTNMEKMLQVVSVPEETFYYSHKVDRTKTDVYYDGEWIYLKEGDEWIKLASSYLEELEGIRNEVDHLKLFASYEKDISLTEEESHYSLILSTEEGLEALEELIVGELGIEGVNVEIVSYRADVKIEKETNKLTSFLMEAVMKISDGSMSGEATVKGLSDYIYNELDAIVVPEYIKTEAVEMELE
ncbi:hypothetical protein LCL95_01565 [Bacillus timonensis]|nr:hypothetical protein [Bacillus timonensis]